jgi:hypothetical protein
VTEEAALIKKSIVGYKCQFTLMSFDPWSNNDSTDQQTWGYNDFDDDMATDSVATIVSQASSSQVIKKSRAQRKSYGSGIEAKRTAFMKNYDTSRSPILLLLRQCGIPDTKSNFLALIQNAVLDCPENERPTHPSRSRKRVKGGLVQWMDMNAEFIQEYILRTYFTQ